ncbi:MAG: MFS transporter [Chloroflexi bacterium]|nr:MFS transporter [Chloroflexota bacterium]
MSQRPSDDAQSAPASGPIEALYQLKGKRLWGTIAGVLLGMLLAALDQTIIATALPRIVSDLGGLDKLSWVVTAYMVTSTAGVPIWGKLSDLFGRRWFFITGLLIFIAGSALTGLAQSMETLIAFRAIQGIGGGMMFGISFAIISDIFPPSERGKWQGLFGAVFAMASIIGPLVGGLLTDNLSWRWIFYVNLPIGFAALAILWPSMPSIKRRISRPSIDYFGVVALLGAIIPLLLALSLGGREFDWSSGQIVGLFTLSALMLAAFIFIETRAKDPLLPLWLFKNSIFTVSMISVFVTGIGMFGGVIFIPLFVQGVIGASATNSGLVLTPMMLCVVVGSTVSGQLISRTGRYRALAVIGPALMTVGLFLLSQMDVTSTRPIVVRNMMIVGIGLGITFPIFLIAVQNAFSDQILGVVTSSVQFFRFLGGTMGVAVLGSILNSRLTDSIARNIPAEVTARIPGETLSRLTSPEALIDPSSRLALESEFARLDAAELFQPFREGVQTAMADSITFLFSIAFAIVAVAIVAGLFLKEIKLRTTHDEPPGG